MANLNDLPTDILYLIAAHAVRAHDRIPPCAFCAECLASLSEHAPGSPYCRNKRPVRALKALANVSRHVREVLRPTMWSCCTFDSHMLVLAPKMSFKAVDRAFSAQLALTAVVNDYAIEGIDVRSLAMALLGPATAFSNLTHLRLHTSFASAAALLDPSMNPCFDRIAHFALMMEFDGCRPLQSNGGRPAFSLDLAGVRFPVCRTLEIVLADPLNILLHSVSPCISALPHIPVCRSLTLAARRLTWSSETFDMLNHLKLVAYDWECPLPDPGRHFPRLTSLDIHLHTHITLPLLENIASIPNLESLNLTLEHVDDSLFPSKPTLVIPALRRLSARPPILSFVTHACSLPALKSLRAVNGRNFGQGAVERWPVAAPTATELVCFSALHRLEDYFMPELVRARLDAECLVSTTGPPGLGALRQWPNLAHLQIAIVSRQRTTLPEVWHDLNLHSTLFAFLGLESLLLDLPSDMWPADLRGAGMHRSRATKLASDRKRAGRSLRISHAAAALQQLTRLPHFQALTVASGFARVELYTDALPTTRPGRGPATTGPSDVTLELTWRGNAQSEPLWNFLVSRASWFEGHRPSALVVRVFPGANAPRDAKLIARVAQWVYGPGNQSARALSFAIGIGPSVKFVFPKPRSAKPSKWNMWSNSVINEEDLKEGWRAAAEALRYEWIAPSLVSSE
ncbi:hypothetical protein BC828DRAFT_414966 [Blastocladiella britannica]|nr:hypothetical protein BC828DRAFT_414966 [Blastocladiella britannica]